MHFNGKHVLLLVAIAAAFLIDPYDPRRDWPGRDPGVHPVLAAVRHALADRTE